jgi:hypothetical protein
MREKQLSDRTSLRGIDVLNNPNLNKGTAFSPKEREDLGLVGLLPDGIETLDDRLSGCSAIWRKSQPIWNATFT